MWARLSTGVVAVGAFLVPSFQSDPCAAIAADAPISAVGAFSDMRYTAEHAYGHTVLLWQAERCVFGLFSWAGGSMEDLPIGELQDVNYSRSDGGLSFSARLSTGVTLLGSAPPQPTRDLFTFSGKLDVARLTGELVHVNQSTPRVGPERKAIVLTASARDAESLQGTATYGAWRQRWAPVLKGRGPKW